MNEIADKNSVKRLAIFVVYDKDGVIDDYIPYYLNELVKNVSHIVIVCNGKLTEDGRGKLSAFTDDVFVRPNVGYDAGAIKDALFNFIGWESVYEYDELLMANDTLYGPLYPLKNVFDEMKERDADFWGLIRLTDQYLDNGFDHVYRRLYKNLLHSYFRNVKKRLLHSEAFRSFWENLQPESLTYLEIASAYEASFTHHFADKGFTYAVYADTAGLESENNVDNYLSIYMAPLDVIACGFPFIKKKVFRYPIEHSLDVHVYENTNAVVEYVRNNTDYDENMIWDNLLRTHSAREITEHLKIRYVLPTDMATRGICNKRIAVVTDLTDSEFAREAASYIENAGLEAVSVNEMNNYDYMCYINDKNLISAETRRRSVLSSLRSAYGNAIASREYVNNIIEVFEENPRLGVLAVPAPYHSKFFSSSNQKQFVNNAVWIKVAAFKNGFEPEDCDLPEEARRNGYYSGIVMTTEHSAVRCADFEFMLSKLCDNLPTAESFARLLYLVNLKNIKNFCASHEMIYLYGTGPEAKKWTNIIQDEKIDFNGYIVSDGQYKQDEFMGRHVYYLSEVIDKRCGIILTVHHIHTKEILPLLAERGFENVLWVNC